MRCTARIPIPPLVPKMKKKTAVQTLFPNKKSRERTRVPRIRARDFFDWDEVFVFVFV